MNMMILRRFVSVLGLLALMACGGGGGDAGSAPFPPAGGGGGGGVGGGGSATAADLVLVVSSPTIASNGSATVTATATAIDANRNAVAAVRVVISADSGAVVTPGGTATGTDGTLTAEIGIGADRSVRTITVTAVSGALSKSTTLAVVTSAPQIPAAADISLALSAPNIANNGTATATATVTAVDANRNTIAGIPVTLRVDNGAAIQVTGTTTDAAGTVRGIVSIGANRANRSIRVTAVSGSLTKESVLQVTGTRITSTALPAVLSPGAAGKIQYKVTDAANAPLTNFDITISGPGGVQTAGKTDGNGNYEFAFTAPAASGPLDVRASSGGIENITTVIVQSGVGSIPPVPLNSVRSASVRANPSVVSVNASGVTENRSEVRALFVGNDNQPIRNIRVRFDLNGDPNSIGGTFAAGSTVIYSDGNGVALSAYIPGTRSSPTDGVTVRACWGYDDFAAGTCPNATTSALTVVSDPLSVTVGTDNLILVSTDLVYTQRFVIQVNDSSGLAKADVQISPLLDLNAFNQGRWVRPPGADAWSQVITTIAGKCDNEDVNRNGVLEVYSNGNREDADNDGQLDPRKADAVVSFDGANRTDATGRLVLRLTYPRNVGSWVDFKLTVAANGVSGTEGRSSFAATLGVPITDVKAESAPPFIISPYGQTDGNPRVTVTTPDGRASASLCSRVTP